MQVRSIISAAILFVGLQACTSPTPGILEDTMEGATYRDFIYCTGYGCSIRYYMKLTDEEWQQVRAYFNEPAPDAAAERVQIANAVGHIESIVAPKANTQDDEAGAAILMGNTRGQLDCIDESHNTTVFLTFMERDSLFTHHTVGDVAHRGMVFDRWFHNTATVIENETGDAYVIDSWFGFNGDPADVVPLEQWQDGWHPEGFENAAEPESAS